MDDEGDGASDDDDDDDDDPDDALHNDGDGGDDFPLRKGISPRNLTARRRRQKSSTKWLPDEIRSRGVSTPKGCRRGCLGPPKAHQARPRGAAPGGPLAAPGSPLAVLRAPPVISDETLFSEFSRIF